MCTLITEDGDVGDTHSYRLVPGAGSADNASFTISGNLLKTAVANLNFENKKTYSIRIRSTDQGGLCIEKVKTINVTNVNEAPTDVRLSNASVAENQPVGTTVGTLSTVDPDAGNTFTYSLVAGAGGADNAKFTISSNLLKTAAIFDYAVKKSYSIRVRATDQGGLYKDKVFTIGVTDVSESGAAAHVAGAIALPSKPAATIPIPLARVDLLAAAMDEIGQLLGQQESDLLDLMYPSLPLGVRPALAVDHALATLYE